LECDNGQALSKSESASKISERAYIAAALYKLSRDAHVQYLYDTIKSSEKTVRYNVAMSLGMVNNKKSKKILYEVLQNDSKDLPRCGAASALIEQNDPEIIYTLRRRENTGKSAPCFNGIVKN
jgi:HEAT repeat protein